MAANNNAGGEAPPQDSSAPAAASQPSGPKLPARKDAVLIFGASGRVGRKVVQRVRGWQASQRTQDASIPASTSKSQLETERAQRMTARQSLCCSLLCQHDTRPLQHHADTAENRELRRGSYSVHVGRFVFLCVLQLLKSGRQVVAAGRSAETVEKVLTEEAGLKAGYQSGMDTHTHTHT